MDTSFGDFYDDEEAETECTTTRVNPSNRYWTDFVGSVSTVLLTVPDIAEADFGVKHFLPPCLECEEFGCLMDQILSHVKV